MLKDALTGFLSPDGEFIPCSYTEHSKVSENILNQLIIPIENPEEDLANLGWMFLQVNFAGIPSTNGNIPLTDAQVKWIVENYDSLNKQQHYFISEKLKNDDDHKHGHYPDYLTNVRWSGLLF